MSEELFVRLEKFEGPLDLLLHLIEKDKVNIYDIPIAQITDQYMAYMAAMEKQNLDLMSEFLLMAATLLDIKARMLLPREIDEETGEEADPRAELVERLLEYKKYKLMAEKLADREFDALQVLYREPALPKEVTGWTQPVDLDALFSEVTLFRLQLVFEQVMKQRAYRVDPERSRFGTIRKEPVSMRKKLGSLIRYAKTHRRFSFRALLDRRSSKTELVVTFLAVLELMKAGKIRAYQETPGDDISIETQESMDREDDFELSIAEEL